MLKIQNTAIPRLLEYNCEIDIKRITVGEDIRGMMLIIIRILVLKEASN